MMLTQDSVKTTGTCSLKHNKVWDMVLPANTKYGSKAFRWCHPSLTCVQKGTKNGFYMHGKHELWGAMRDSYSWVYVCWIKLLLFLFQTCLLSLSNIKEAPPIHLSSSGSKQLVLYTNMKTKNTRKETLQKNTRSMNTHIRQLHDQLPDCYHWVVKPLLEMMSHRLNEFGHWIFPLSCPKIDSKLIYFLLQMY